MFVQQCDAETLAWSLSQSKYPFEGIFKYHVLGGMEVGPYPDEVKFINGQNDHWDATFYFDKQWS